MTNYKKNLINEVMQEQLIGFELAKLAKEKGFNGYKSKRFYYKDGATHISPGNWSTNKRCWNTWDATQGVRWSAPTQNLLQDWIWKTHKYWIEIFIDDDKTFGYLITYFEFNGRIDKPIKKGYINPKKCLEEGLKQVLELIK